MRALTLGAAISFGLLAAIIPGDPPRAQSDTEPPRAQSDTFRLVVCNVSNVRTVDMVILTSEGPGAWLLSGFYRVDDTGCTEMGRWPRSVFYTYFIGTARNGQRESWGGGDTHQCVPWARFTRRIGSENYQCRPGEIRLPFTRHQVRPDSDGFELTLR
jgi:hypothetical protein